MSIAQIEDGPIGPVQLHLAAAPRRTPRRTDNHLERLRMHCHERVVEAKPNLFGMR